MKLIIIQNSNPLWIGVKRSESPINESAFSDVQFCESSELKRLSFREGIQSVGNRRKVVEIEENGSRRSYIHRRPSGDLSFRKSLKSAGSRMMVVEIEGSGSGDLLNKEDLM